jgi:hypothetical protein
MKQTIILFFVIIVGIVILNSCSKEYSFEKATPVGNASFSLKDSVGNCLPDSIYGTYYNGVTPGADTAYLAMQVNVDSVGSYKIYTDLQNGFMFADSGFFNTTGIQTVLLRPIGTPILQTATTFSVPFDTTFCSFTIYVQDSTGTGLGGGTGGGGTDSTNLSDTAWKFTVNTSTFNGPIDSAFIYTDTSGNYFTLYGYTPATGDSAFAVSIYLPNGVIESGSYSTSTGAGIYFKDLMDTAATHYIYHADPTTTGASITITLTYDSSGHIVDATFNGTAVDLQGNVITITNGRFKAKIT